MPHYKVSKGSQFFVVKNLSVEKFLTMETAYMSRDFETMKAVVLSFGFDINTTYDVSPHSVVKDAGILDKVKKYFKCNSIVITFVHLMIILGDVEAINKMLSFHPDLNKICQRRPSFSTGDGGTASELQNLPEEFVCTPLHLAVVLSHNQLIKLLMNQPNMKLNTLDCNGYTALDLAFMRNNLKMARKMTLKGISFALSGDKISSRLTVSAYIINHAEASNFDTIFAMLDDGYSLGTNCLEHFIMKMDLGDEERARLSFTKLMQHHQNVFQRVGEDKSSYLHLAVDEICVWLVEELLNYGLDSNDRDVRGRTPLHRLMAANSKDLYDVYDETFDDVSSAPAVKILECLSKAGADLNALDSEDNSLLMMATFNRNQKLILKLLANGVSCDVDKNGFIPLHYYCIEGEVQERVLCAFEDAGCDINAATKKGYTPLHFLINSMGREGYDNEAMQLMLNRGANLFAKTLIGDTPLAFAVINGNAKLLLSSMSVINRNVFSRLLKEEDNQGYTLLQLATINPNINAHVMMQMIALGADTNKRVSPFGLTCLHMLFLPKSNLLYPHIYETLCEKRNINIVNLKPPCDNSKHVSALEFLVMHSNADINAEARQGETPLDLALSFGDYSGAKLLLKQLADPSTVKLRKIMLAPGISSVLNMLFDAGLRDLTKFFNAPDVQWLLHTTNCLNMCQKRLRTELLVTQEELDQKARKMPSLLTMCANKSKTILPRKQLASYSVYPKIFLALQMEDGGNTLKFRRN